MTPAGRTSSIKALGKTFILQTEFLIKPRARIVTSVALDGQVIHKVERTFDREIISEDDLRAAETAVLSQHDNLAKKILANGADFIKQTRSIKISQSDRLTIIPGVAYVADIDEKINSENPHPIFEQSKIVLDIADAISETSRLGQFKIGAMISEQGKFLLSKADSKNTLISLKPDADIGTIMREALNNE